MNKIISELTKKLTITMIVLVFSFILLAPTADARWENWSKPQNRIITIEGDDDPFGVDIVNENKVYRYNPFIYYWNILIIKHLMQPQIIDIEKEQYEPESMP